MFSKELEELIEASLVDGVITDKEREVIKKRAVSEGVDPDEVDMVLDSEVQKIRKKQQAAMTKVKKCPNCGEVMPALSGVCPSCGHTVDVSANDNKELFSLIEDMENALVELKSGGADPEKQTAIIEKYRRMAKTLYSENKKVQYLLAEIDAELTNAKKARRKKTILKYIVRYGWIVLAVLCVFVKCQCDSYNEEHEKTQQKEAIEEIIQFVNEGKLTEANMLATKIQIPEELRKKGTSFIVSEYDHVFLSLINAYLAKGQLAEAEEIGSIFRSKINNDMSWDDSSCYKVLKSKFSETGRDFSSLKSKYDYD